MKKLFILVFVMLFVLTGCESISSKSEFEKAIEMMIEEDSVKMVMEVFIPDVGTIDAVIGIEGNASKMVMLEEEIYFLFEDDVEYEIIEFNGEYVRFLAPEDEDSLEGFNDFDDFTDEDFEYNEDDDFYYTLIEVEDMEDLKIRIENGYVVEMVFGTELDDTDVIISIVFSNFGEVNIELPEYRIATDLDEALKDFDDGYTLFTSASGFIIQSDSITIQFDTNDDYIEISLNDLEILFYPITDIITYYDGEESATLDEFIYSGDYIHFLSQDEFDAIEDAYYVKKAE